MGQYLFEWKLWQRRTTPLRRATQCLRQACHTQSSSFHGTFFLKTKGNLTITKWRPSFIEHLKDIKDITPQINAQYVIFFIFLKSLPDYNYSPNYLSFTLWQDMFQTKRAPSHFLALLSLCEDKHLNIAVGLTERTPGLLNASTKSIACLNLFRYEISTWLLVWNTKRAYTLFEEERN